MPLLVDVVVVLFGCWVYAIGYSVRNKLFGWETLKRGFLVSTVRS